MHIFRDSQCSHGKKFSLEEGEEEAEEEEES